jgi:Xaa-Pro aminopeptidase
MVWVGLVLALPLLAQDAAPGIPAKEFEERRARLLEKIKDGVGVMDSGPVARNPAAAFDFRYFFNYHEGDAIAVFVDGKAHLFVERVEAAAPSGVKDIRPRAEFETFAEDILPKAAKVYTRLRAANLEIVKKHAKEVAGTLGAEVTKLRLIKSKVEQDMTRKSTAISCAAHAKAMKAIKPGMNEREIQKIYEEEFKREGAVPGYGYICGSGINGCTLHYSANNQEIASDTLIVCDCGASYHGYVADVTRTFPTGGKFTKEQAAKYQLVRDAQTAAEKVLKPGATLRELHAAAAQVFEDAGQKTWSFAHSKDRTVNHGLGHFVGLYVHDSGGGETKFEPGMVITIEPGWYDKDQKWGIRIEDMYLVTADGFERLSTGAPREIEEIEKLMAGK